MAANCLPKTSLKQEGLVEPLAQILRWTGSLPIFPSKTGSGLIPLRSNLHLPLIHCENGNQTENEAGSGPHGWTLFRFIWPPCFSGEVEMAYLLRGSAGGQGRVLMGAGASCRRPGDTPKLSCALWSELH